VSPIAAPAASREVTIVTPVAKRESAARNTRLFSGLDEGRDGLSWLDTFS
jgi:hypothetical protein